MMKPVYILSASAVSPKQNFEEAGFPAEIRNTDEGMLFIKEPNYRKYINPVAIRRMSRLLKMGISTGMNALEQAGIEQPDAIITGTGRGSMADMEDFLTGMIAQQEEALTPTAFIQSTYNSVNGWLALQTKSNGYNQTYVHRGASLELALQDAQMLLNEENEINYVLAGCFDEITPDYVRVKNKIGYWKKPPINNSELLQHNHTPGSIAGEGSAFFVLSGKNENALCCLTSIKTLQDAAPSEVLFAIGDLLAERNLTPGEIDLVICGMSGDARYEPLYTEVKQTFATKSAIAAFKHLCGEYDTSTGFALWAAAEIFKTRSVPDAMQVEEKKHTTIKNVLIVNHYILNSTSLILLQAAE